MIINILTIFPDLIEKFLDNGIFRRAFNNASLEVKVFDLRAFSDDKHKSVDDKPFGGGAGMVLKMQPFNEFFQEDRGKVVYLSPQGITLDNKLAKTLSEEKELTLIAGHYRGIDQRVIDKYVDLEVSIGDYVLSGGELPALVLLDCVARLVPDVLNNAASVEDSFHNSLLDVSSYTRPAVIDDEEIPAILLSGNHKEIDQYRKREALIRTLVKRPDLLKNLSKEDKEALKELIE